VPPSPVNVIARFVGGACKQDILEGRAVLSISTGDASDPDECFYWCVAVVEDGRCIGFRLSKFGSSDTYYVPCDLSACGCRDRIHRPDRPGGCRHMVALRQALPTIRR
jgi:hypothetical protein